MRLTCILAVVSCFWIEVSGADPGTPIAQIRGTKRSPPPLVRPRKRMQAEDSITTTTTVPGEGRGMRRVPGVIADRFRDRLTPRIQALVAQQEIDDDRYDEFTPDLSTDFEIVPGMGKLTLLTVIGRGGGSVVYSVVENRDVVIKYEAFYHDFNLHPLLRDYWLGLEASRFNLSAKPYFVSPAASLERMGGPKTMFKMALPTLDDSPANPRIGLVRYMVVERLGRSVTAGGFFGHTKEKNVTIPDAIVFGALLVHLIGRVHELGIIHGDIHGGNVCVSRTNPRELKLIDFGRGMFTDEENDTKSDHRFLDDPDIEVAFTPHQLLGFKLSRADDVYKAMHLVSYLMAGPGLMVAAQTIAKRDREAYLRWKLAGHPLTGHPADPFVAATHLSDDQRESARTELSYVYGLVTNIPSARSPIPYKAIYESLKRVRLITKLPRTESISTPAP